MSRNAAEAEGIYSAATSLGNLVIFDPFAGSGTTIVEALKFGASAVGYDINPVATLVQRQAVQPWDWRRLEDLYRQVEKAVRAEIDRVHRSEDGRTVLYYFWVGKVACLTCGEWVHLFNSPVYSKHVYSSTSRAVQTVCPVCLSVASARDGFEDYACQNGHVVTEKGPVTGAKVSCSQGHEHKVIDSLAGKIPEGVMYAKMVVDDKGAKTYEGITDWDRTLYGECESLLAALPPDAVLPAGKLTAGNNTSQAMRWNYSEWSDFFNARQLYSLSLTATALRDLPDCSEREALCALFSGVLEFNNTFTSFKGEGTGAVRHMFAHHVLQPQRTPLEAHPWGHPKSSGSFSTLMHSRLRRAHNYKSAPTDLVLARNGSVARVTGISIPLDQSLATSPPEAAVAQSAYLATGNSADTSLPSGSVDLVVTDPPYMDNVHYAELADFFHAWLKGIVPYAGYPSGATTRAPGEVQDSVPAAFGKAISEVWRECARVLKPEGLVAFTFHQARIAGWVELIQSLQRAGLVVTAVQPVMGEMTTSVVKAGAREPSTLDSVVVCRKREFVGATYHATEEAAYSAAVTSLRRLVDGGVTVGAGDVRSVLRGTLLAFHAGEPTDLGALLLEVDRRADQAIADVIGQPEVE